jgi:hypothetical protein
MSIEDRIKRLEDELGITDRDAKQQYRRDLINLHVTYGFSKSESKLRAYHWDQAGASINEVEAILIRRRATKQECV